MVHISRRTVRATAQGCAARRKSRWWTVSRSGTTLIELVTSLAIATIVLAALGSAVLVASGALPKPAAETDARGRQQFDRLLLELSEATRVALSSSTAVRFLVPDRTGDGQPEEIIYIWMGLPSGVLIRSYNGVQETVLEDVAHFEVSLRTGVSSRFDILKVQHDLAESIQVTLETSGHRVTRQCRLLSRPPMLDGWVRTDFDAPPQTRDLDRVGGNDWSLLFGQIGAADVAGGVWASSGILSLSSQWALTQPTVVSLRVWPQQANNSASVQIYGDLTALGMVDLLLDVTRQSNGQARTRLREVGLLSTRTLLETSRTGEWFDIVIVLLPAGDKVRLLVNGQLIGEAQYNTKVNLLSTGQIRISGNAATVLWDHVEVRIGGSEL